MQTSSAARQAWSRSRIAFIVVAVVLLLVAIAVPVALRASASTVHRAGPDARDAPATAVASTPTPTPTPPPDPYPADSTAYPLTGLPLVDPFAVIRALPVDADPMDAPTGDLATPAVASIPVFAAPGQAPVAQLLQSQRFDGTTVPVVERHPAWLRVLLVGRSGLPSEGVHGQLTGWVRVADVTTAPDPYAVHVDLAAHTVEVTNAGAVVQTTSDFGYGTAKTPTPVGRTFIMTHDAPRSYTRGTQVIALGVQSPTLDGFDGASVAVTAFHYYADRSGAISNGCIRLNTDMVATLLTLPYGTPVMVTA